MVRVLSNGDVVADDDVRAKPASNSNNLDRRNIRNAGDFSSASQQGVSGGTNALSGIWDQGNERLRQFGIPNFEIGNYNIEPLHIVVAIIALVMFGPMALILVGAIVIVSQMSSNSNSPASSQPMYSTSAQQSPSVPSRTTIKKTNSAFSGSGQRLGN